MITIAKENELQMKGRKEGVRAGILGAVKILRSYGADDDMVITTIMQVYQLSKEEAEKYILSEPDII